jgi:hypothetical protein
MFPCGCQLHTLKHPKATNSQRKRLRICCASKDKKVLFNRQLQLQKKKAGVLLVAKVIKHKLVL